MARINAMKPEPVRLTERMIRDVRGILEGCEAVNAAYVHGSMARGNAHRESDLDVALLAFPGKALSMDVQMDLTGRITLVAGRVVDIGILSTTNLIYARQVLGSRITLFEREPETAALFFMSVLGEYDDFKMARSEVERAYAAR